MRNKPGKLESAYRGGLDVATFGFAPKLSSLLGTAIARQLDLSENKNETFADAYQRGLAHLREQNREAFEENPISYSAGGIAGALASPIKGGQGATLGQRIKRGVGLGGLYGIGTSDSGEAGSFEPSNVMDTIKGAGIGALAELILPPVFRGTGYVANKLTPNVVKEGISSVGNMFNRPPISTSAMEAFQPQVISQGQSTLSNLAKQAPQLEKGELATSGINKIQQQEKLAKELASNAYEQAKVK
jgi:hypothetical protein